MSKFQSLLDSESKYTFKAGQSSDCVKFWLLDKEPTGTNFGENLADGLLAQTVQASITKAVRPIYEIGTYNYYLVDGRPSGSGTIASLFGPKRMVLSSLAKFASVCTPSYLVIMSKGGCTPESKEGNKPTYTCFGGGILTGITMALNATDFTVTNQLSFLFMSADYSS